jgi:metal-responsive CopG/Arc/MetJ family transcriptional regulator
MAQLVARIDDDLLAKVDLVVSWGEMQTRSDVVRQALVELIERKSRERTGRLIADGYRRLPQTDAEVAGLHAAALDMIAQEPW